jgi:hypothetical protein
MAVGGILMGISSLVGAIGTFQAQKFQQQKAKEQAQVGRIQADQIDTAYREELSSTLNNIRAIRATTGVAADSPTTLAVENQQTKISDRNRSRDVANRQMQANEHDASARFLGSAANVSLFGGVAKSLPYFFGA